MKDLSILIPTLPARIDYYSRLIKQLNTQIYLVNAETNSYKRIYSNNIKVLTYNLNWQNMGSVNGMPIEQCKEKDLCSNNINKLILNELPLDFIFLQELANVTVVLKDIEAEYHLLKTKSDKEEMGMLIHKKYNVINSVSGEFEKGRPFLVAFLKEGICLVCVHMGHKKNILDELKKIEKVIYFNKIDTDPYRIILGGDFNSDIGKEIVFCEKVMNNFRKKFTCCLYTTHMNKNINVLKYMNGKNIDHILDSHAEPVYGTVVTPVDSNNMLLPGSDHLGLYAELIKLN